MIIHDFYVFGSVFSPPEADSIAFIYPNTVLPLPVSLKRLETVTGRKAEILQLGSGVEHIELANCTWPQLSRKYVSSLSRFFSVKEILGPCISKGDDHGNALGRASYRVLLIITTNVIYSNILLELSPRKRYLTVVAADERVIVVGFLAFQPSRLRRGNTILLGC